MIRVATPAEISHALDLRRLVFMVEQGISEEEEFDGLDDVATHLLVWSGDIPVGTARILIDGDYGKIGRVAVLKDHRGTGLGKALITAAMDELRKLPVQTAKLGAQNHAIGFYETLGFTVSGPEYLDAGIPHHDMTCPL